MGLLTSPSTEYNQLLGGKTAALHVSNRRYVSEEVKTWHATRDLRRTPLRGYRENWRQLGEIIKPANMKNTIVGICCSDNVHVNRTTRLFIFSARSLNFPHYVSYRKPNGKSRWKLFGLKRNIYFDCLEIYLDHL